MHSDSTAIDSSGQSLPFQFDTAVASGVFLRLDIDQELDCDLKPNPDDFSISLPVCEANANSTVRPIALQLKAQQTSEQPRTSIILVLDEALPPVSELELHYHPQEALMWSNTLDDSISAFIIQIPVKLSRHEPKEAFSTKLLETIAKKSQKAPAPPPEDPVIAAIDSNQISIALNRFLIPHQGVAVGDFRAEAHDRWVTVAAAAVRQSASEEPHEIQLALKETLEPGDTLTIQFKAKRYPITALDGSQITNFKVSATYQGPGEFSTLSVDETDSTNAAPASDANAEQLHMQALESILDEDTAVAQDDAGTLGKAKKLFSKSPKEPKPPRAKMPLLQKVILGIFLAGLAWLAVVVFQLMFGFSAPAPKTSQAPVSAPAASVAAPSTAAKQPAAATPVATKPCQLTFNSGNQYSGSCNGAQKPHGNGRFQWTSGSSYEGNFANGSRSGQGFMTYPNGAKYEGQWLNDKKHGQGTYWSENGNRFEGRFEQGKMTSDGTCFMSDGSEVSGFCPT